jgi:hypothetical protein
MTDSHNEGIVMQGGSLQAGNLGVGRGATVHGAGSAGADPAVHAALERFRDELARHVHTLDNAAEVQTAAAALEAEIANDDGNPVTIRGLLAGITGAVKTVTPLVTAAGALQAAVLAVL